MSQVPRLETQGLERYLEIVTRRKWLLVTSFAAVLSMVVLTTLRTEPQFEATATLMVEANSKGAILSEGARSALLNFGSTRIANHVELIKSYALAQRVLASLPDSGVRTKFMKICTSSEDPTLCLQRFVSARPLRDADIVQVRITAPDAELAAELVNRYVLTYQQYNLDQSRADVSAIRQFIAEQLQVIAARLDSSEKALEEFKRSNRLIHLDAQTQALVSHQAELGALRYRSLAEAAGRQAQLSYVRQCIATERDGMTEKLTDWTQPLVSNLKATLDQLQIEKTNLRLQGFPDETPRVQSLNRLITEIQTQLTVESERLLKHRDLVDPVNRLKELYLSAQALEGNQAGFAAQAVLLDQVLNETEKRLDQLPSAERTLARLTRDVETNRRVYTLMSERYEEARVQEAGRLSDVRIVDNARGARQTRPNIPASTLLGLLLAGALAFGLVFAVDHFDTSVHDAKVLEAYGLSVLANIPVLGSRRERRHGTMISYLMSHEQPDTRAAESFRVLRTSLDFLGNEAQVRTLVVTSANPGEGKSTIAVNLATVFAQAGRRTLLVDADLRRPVLHQVLGYSRRPGLAELILTTSANTADSQGLIRQTRVENLYCLPAGLSLPSPADLLNSPAAQRVWKALKNSFDCVIIDAPPVLIAADAPILTASADAVLLVVRAHGTSRDVVFNAHQILKRAGARLLGVALNCVRYSRHRSYYYHYYRYTSAEHCHQPSARMKQPAPSRVSS